MCPTVQVSLVTHLILFEVLFCLLQTSLEEKRFRLHCKPWYLPFGLLVFGLRDNSSFLFKLPRVYESCVKVWNVSSSSLGNVFVLNVRLSVFFDDSVFFLRFFGLRSFRVSYPTQRMKRTQLFLIVRCPPSRRPASVAHIRQCLKDERSTTSA